jgi:hypothetical protein
MRLQAAGHPLHTRALSVVFTTRADGRLDVDGAILDLRKRGFVPVAGDLQGSGIIHDMRLAAVVDPATRVLERIAADQRSVAFEATAVTGGESCRDPIGRVAALGGTSLDGAWGRRIATEIGGPRGCSHLVTLAHLLGATGAWLLDRERALHGETARRANERVFRRDLVVDGHEPEPGRLVLAAQLSDLHLAPAAPRALPMERLAEAREVRVLAEVAFPAGTIERLDAAERRRDRDDLESAPWRDRGAATSWLVGERLGGGVTAALLARFGDEPADRPLLDVLLNLAPTLVQCAAAIPEIWALAARGGGSVVGLGGVPDSCWMWRRDGALARTLAREIGTPAGRS